MEQVVSTVIATTTGKGVRMTDLTRGFLYGFWIGGALVAIWASVV